MSLPFPFSMGIVLTICRAVLAISISLHVVLHKKDTSAAIGWVGIVWLMPITGSVLYLMFGINRVSRLAKRLADKVSRNAVMASTRSKRRAEGRFAPLASMVGKITGRPLLGGGQITCLHDGDQGYPRMLDAIRRAQHSVLLCSYIFRADGIGGQFIDALIEAHARGIQVRVLVDGIGAGYFSCPVHARLRRAGVPCGRFMHSTLPWRMPFINLRNHRKILVVDGVLGFLGGLNIGDENLVSHHPAHPVSDTHFQLEGPVVSQLAEVFAWDWSFTWGEDLEGPAFFPEIPETGKMTSRIVTAGPDTDLEKIEYTMLQAMTLATEDIRLMTPYLLPGARFMTELGLAALRGVTVDIIIPFQSNHPPMDWACRANIQPLLDAGCRVWLVTPPFNHSKLMVVDRKWTFLGSSNLDMRSLRLNFEVNLECYDSVLAEELDDFMCTHRSRRLTHHDLDRRSFPVRLRDASTRLLLPYL